MYLGELDSELVCNVHHRVGNWHFIAVKCATNGARIDFDFLSKSLNILKAHLTYDVLHPTAFVLVVIEVVESLTFTRATAGKVANVPLIVGVENDHVLLIAHRPLSTSGTIPQGSNECRCLKLM